MVEEEHNLVLEHLRIIRKDSTAIKDDVRDIKSRLASIETKLAHMHADDVNQMHRIDDMKENLDRINQRLELYDPKH